MKAVKTLTLFNQLCRVNRAGGRLQNGERQRIPKDATVSRVEPDGIPGENKVRDLEDLLHRIA